MPAYFGLDIGSSSVKLAHFDGGKFKSLGMVVNQTGKNLMDMTNPERLALVEIVKTMISESRVKSKQVVASIPESLVFSRVLKFPYMSTPELATAVKWELDQAVPFPPDQIEVSWVVLSKPNRVIGTEKISVYVVAVPTKVSDIYTTFLDLLELEPVRIENEVPALSRVYGPISTDESPTLVMNMGASGTTMVIVGETNLFNSYFFPVGGDAITKFIGDSFSLHANQADSYKTAYGIQKDQIDGKIYNAVKPLLDNLTGEVKKMIASFQNENKDKAIKRIMVSGGGAYLKGLPAYLQETFPGIEIAISNPFFEVEVPEKYTGYGPYFDVAKGLSM